MNLFFRFWPVLAVLGLNIVIAGFAGEFTFLSRTAALWKAPLRYLRLTLNLVLPLAGLPLLCYLAQALINRPGKRLTGAPDLPPAFSPLRVWLLRPFQGLGLSFLFASRLLLVLQGYAGAPIGTSEVLPPAAFQWGRFLVVTGLGLLIATLLSLGWTLDDLGVRYRNDRTGEVRMVGKYLGVVLPVGFGFYGFFGLLAQDPFITAFILVFQMVVTLYPPSCTLAVIHALYVRRFGGHLVKCLRIGQASTRR
ncbi:MAG: hypothetical protein ACUVXF_01285 [Desulfobaccales bacterium]